MRTISALTAVALFAATNAAAAAPDPLAKAKLEALKKRLPAILTTWAQDRYLRMVLGKDYAPVLRRVRTTADAEAKVTIHFCDKPQEQRTPTPDYLLTVSHRYHDGLWTAVRFQWSYAPERGGPPLQEAGHFLLDAIDEAAEQ